MAIGDLLYMLSGQPDPARQIAQALDPLSQPGPQPAAQGGAGPGSGPPSSPAGGPAPAQGGNSYPGQPQPPGSAPQPMAYQSSPDMAASNQQLANPPNLMSLYLQLAQRQQANDQISRGLALIAANHSAPGMRNAIMQSAMGGGMDAGQTMNNLMNIYSMQQGMQIRQQELQSAPDIAAKTGLPLSYVQSEIMAGRGGELRQGMMPTEKQRDIQFEHDQFIKGGGTEDQWQSTYLPLIISGGIPGLTPETRQRNAALIKWQNDPTNAGKPTPSYLTDDVKWKTYNEDLVDAKKEFNGVNQSLGNYIDSLGDVSSSKELDSLAGHPISGGGAAVFPTTEAAQLFTKMKGLAGLSQALAARGGPKGVGQNHKQFGANTEDFTNLGITDYRGDVIQPRIKQALTAQANAYGAAGMANSMPGYLKPYLDPMYQTGGDLDIGGAPKAVTPDKNLKQPGAEELRGFQNDLERFGPKTALKHLRDQGYDTSSLD